MENWTLVGIGTELYNVLSDDDALFLSSQLAKPNNYCGLKWNLDLKKLSGSVINLTGELFSENSYSAGLWLRASTNDLLISDAMYDRLVKGSCDWTQQELCIEIPQNVTIATYGLWMIGHGKCGIRNIKIEMQDELGTNSQTIYNRTDVNTWSPRV